MERDYDAQCACAQKQALEEEKVKFKVLPWEEGNFTKGLNNEALVDEVKITYVQDPDCTEDSEGDVQTLTVEARNNGTDRFININTSSWSISKIEDLVILLKDFCQRAGIKDI